MAHELDKNIVPLRPGRYKVNYKLKPEGEEIFKEYNDLVTLTSGSCLADCVASYARKNHGNFTFLSLVCHEKISVDVKCTYSPGLFRDMYFVSFPGSKESYPLGQGEVMVHQSAFKKINDLEGLVDATLVKKEDPTSTVVLSDCEAGGVYSIIPNEFIVF